MRKSQKVRFCHNSFCQIWLKLLFERGGIILVLLLLGQTLQTQPYFLAPARNLPNSTEKSPVVPAPLGRITIPEWMRKKLAEEIQNFYESEKRRDFLGDFIQWDVMLSGRSMKEFLTDIRNCGREALEESWSYVGGGETWCYSVANGQIFTVVILDFIRNGDLEGLYQLLEWYRINNSYLLHGVDGTDAPKIGTRYFRYLEALTYGWSLSTFKSFEKSIHLLDFNVHINLIEFLRLLRVIRAVHQVPFSLQQLEDVVNQLLAVASFSEEWTLVEEMDSDEVVRVAIWQWLKRQGQVMQWLDFETLSDRLFVRKDDRRLFLKKEYKAVNPIGFAYYHRDLNSPLREVLAFHLGRAIGANTAETLVTPEAIFSALSLTTDPDSLPQQTMQSAEGANLVLDVLTRRWDDVKEMIQRSRVGETFVSFDFDQGFNSHFRSLRGYLNFMKNHHQRGEAEPWTEQDFDPKVIWQTIRMSQALDIAQLIQDLKSKLSPTFPSREVNKELARYAKFLTATQKTIEEDVKAVYKALTGQELPLPSEQLERANEFMAQSL